MRTKPNEILLPTLLALVLALGCAPRAEEETAVAGEPAVDEEEETLTEEIADVADPYENDWRWPDLAEMDGDGDGTVTREEFDAAFGAIHASWDVNDDGITWAELETAAYDWWDTDENEILEEDEWKTATDRWTGAGFEWPAWETADIDLDGDVDAEEFLEIFRESAGIAAWDADGNGLIGADEMAGIFWNLADADADGTVDADEWDRWTP